jgi:hypothetical protein
MDEQIDEEKAHEAASLDVAVDVDGWVVGERGSTEIEIPRHARCASAYNAWK